MVGNRHMIGRSFENFMTSIFSRSLQTKSVFNLVSFAQFLFILINKWSTWPVSTRFTTTAILKSPGELTLSINLFFKRLAMSLGFSLRLDFSFHHVLFKFQHINRRLIRHIFDSTQNGVIFLWKLAFGVHSNIYRFSSFFD